MLKQVAIHLGQLFSQNEFHKSFAINLPNPNYSKRTIYYDFYFMINYLFLAKPTNISRSQSIIFLLSFFFHCLTAVFYAGLLISLYSSAIY